MPPLSISMLRSTQLLVFACLAATAAHGACTLPPAPSKIPDGATATDGEMRAVMHAMSQYELDVGNYIKCLAFEASQGRLAAEEQARLRTDALDRHQGVVTRFNAQMRVYMAR
jgi:hypothetical protein